MTIQHYHAAKIIIIPHTTKLFPNYFINNQSSETCAPAPSAHKQAHIVRKTIATLLRRQSRATPLGARACLRVQNSRFTG